MRADYSECDEEKSVQPIGIGQAEIDLGQNQKAIDWQEWWPFERATGDALRQLNRKKKLDLNEFEEAWL